MQNAGKTASHLKIASPAYIWLIPKAINVPPKKTDTKLTNLLSHDTAKNPIAIDGKKTVAASGINSYCSRTNLSTL